MGNLSFPEQKWRSSGLGGTVRRGSGGMAAGMEYKYIKNKIKHNHLCLKIMSLQQTMNEKCLTF